MATSSPSKLRYLDPEVLQEIGSLELVAREVVEGLHVGMHKSPLRGFSTEFAQHRPYVPGDDLRHLDWRVYARTGRYYLKLYEAETNLTANLLLDQALAPGAEPTPLSVAVPGSGPLVVEVDFDGPVRFPCSVLLADPRVVAR